MLAVPLLILLLTSQASPCPDVESCRAQALIAHAAKDYERFHDLAWAAYRKGRPNNADLMLLVARAQSLSGRPGDALVMLERAAAIAPIPGDVPTDPDFAKVHALPRWKEASATLKLEAAPSAKAPAAGTSVPAPAAKVSAPPASVSAPSASAPFPLSFTTLLSPTALAHDAVSKRFIVADREARRVAVIDENTGQVSTMIGAKAALGKVDGIAIDPQQGDLWIASSNGAEATLHKMQLISGRVLTTVALRGITSDVVAMAFVRGSGLLIADGAGTLWRVHTSGRTEKLADLEYVPRALAADASGRIYVAAGGPRLARFTIAESSLRRTGVVEVEQGIPTDSPFAVSGGRLYAIVRSGGSYELRTMRIK